MVTAAVTLQEIQVTSNDVYKCASCLLGVSSDTRELHLHIGGVNVCDCEAEGWMRGEILGQPAMDSFLKKKQFPMW